MFSPLPMPTFASNAAPSFPDEDTTITPEMSSSAQSPFDLFFRIWADNDELQVYGCHTQEISAAFKQWYEAIKHENALLKTCLSNLWKNYQYQQEYTAFLLGSYSESEFMEVSKKYATPFNGAITHDELLQGYQLISDTLQTPLTSYDLSVLFNADCSWIEQQYLDIAETSPLSPSSEL